MTHFIQGLDVLDVLVDEESQVIWQILHGRGPTTAAWSGDKGHYYSCEGQERCL